MLTFEKVLAGFKDYLDEDTRYEVLMASRGYVILEWGMSNKTLESATFCPTPEAMKEALLNALEGYLEYKLTLCNRNLTDDEREMIEAQVEKMDDLIQ